MGAIKRRIPGESEPITLISDAAERAHGRRAGGISAPGGGVRVTVCQPLPPPPRRSFVNCRRRLGVRTRVKALRRFRYAPEKTRHRLPTPSAITQKATTDRQIDQSEDRSMQTTTVAADSSVAAAGGTSVRQGTGPASIRPGS